MSDLDLDAIEQAMDASEGRTVAPAATREDVRALIAEVHALREQVATLEGGRRQLKLVADAFGVERTEWMVADPPGRITASAPGLAIPDDCDTCEVVIDSDVYEAMTDLLALLDASHDQGGE